MSLKLSPIKPRKPMSKTKSTKVVVGGGVGPSQAPIFPAPPLEQKISRTIADYHESVRLADALYRDRNRSVGLAMSRWRRARAERFNARCSQRDVARVMGVSQPLVSSLETGGYPWTLEFYGAYVEAVMKLTGGEE